MNTSLLWISTRLGTWRGVRWDRPQPGRNPVSAHRGGAPVGASWRRFMAPLPRMTWPRWLFNKSVYLPCHFCYTTPLLHFGDLRQFECRRKEEVNKFRRRKRRPRL